MSTESKDALLTAFAEIGKALASPLRLELLDLLAQGERSVEALADTAAARLGNTSAQLRQLRVAGLVSTRREGTHVYYRLAGPAVAALLAEVRATAVTHNAEAARAAADYLGAGVEHIGRDELLQRARSRQVTVIDVRPAPEYAAGHIPGAVSFPIDELPARLDELGNDEIVAYCRGAYCVFARDAVRVLHAHGRRARRLEDGFLEWRLAGLPVTAGAAA